MKKNIDTKLANKAIQQDLEQLSDEVITDLQKEISSLYFLWKQQREHFERIEITLHGTTGCSFADQNLTELLESAIRTSTQEDFIHETAKAFSVMIHSKEAVKAFEWFNENEDTHNILEETSFDSSFLIVFDRYSQIQKLAEKIVGGIEFLHQSNAERYKKVENDLSIFSRESSNHDLQEGCHLVYRKTSIN